MRAIGIKTEKRPLFSQPHEKSLPSLSRAWFAVCILLATSALGSNGAGAQTPAKQLFGSKTLPANLQARSLGSYARGCLAGGVAMPVDGPAWQAMRLSRNRIWGHPTLIAFLEKLATDARQYDGWNGLLVGDIAQPRGGPMSSGHASHQIGLDADIWLRPMPEKRFTKQERERVSAISMLKSGTRTVDMSKFTSAH
uniref:penicillin-insensitive murein endopeptidase n=1 Tax=uncultured Cohaesibacter sp. TaxID=1002546 RepID=UPI00292DE6E1